MWERRKRRGLIKRDRERKGEKQKGREGEREKRAPEIRKVAAAYGVLPASSPSACEPVFWGKYRV